MVINHIIIIETLLKLVIEKGCRLKRTCILISFQDCGKHWEWVLLTDNQFLVLMRDVASDIALQVQINLLMSIIRMPTQHVQ